MGIRDKRRGGDLKGARKGNRGIKNKIEREMRKSRRITRTGSAGVRRSGAMYDYRERRDGKVSVARGELGFFFSSAKQKRNQRDSFLL